MGRLSETAGQLFDRKASAARANYTGKHPHIITSSQTISSHHHISIPQWILHVFIYLFLFIYWTDRLSEIKIQEYS